MHGHLPKAALPLVAERRRQTRLIATLILTEFAAAIETTMLFSALPTLYGSYKNPIGVGWLLSGFMLVSAIAAAICGRGGDLFGRPRVLLGVLVIAVSGSLIAWLAPTLEGVIAGRVIQGVARAVMPLCYGLAYEQLPVERRSLAVGCIAGTATVGSGIGLVLGGAIVDTGHWRLLFLVSALVVACAMVAIVSFAAPSPRRYRGEPLDVAGAVLFAIGSGALLIAIASAARTGWGAALPLRLLAASAVLLVIWIRHELRHPHPLIDLRLLGNRAIGLANLAVMLGAIGIMQSAQIMSLLLQQSPATGAGIGLTATTAGIFALPTLLVGLIASPVSGYLCGRSGGRSMMLTGFACLTVAWSLLAASHHSAEIIFALLMLGGTGMAIIWAAVPNVLIGAAPPDRVSEVTGFMQLVRATGQSIGAQLVTYLLATTTIAGASGALPDDRAYTLTLSFLGVTASGAFVLCIWLPRFRRPPAA